MNTENIVGLSEQLKSMGFLNVAHALAKRICFRPQTFSLLQRVERGEYSLTFQLSFGCKDQSDHYVLEFYDAILQHGDKVEEEVMGVNLNTLKQLMTEIDWKAAFDFTNSHTVDLVAKGVFDKEQKIEKVMRELETLETTQPGRAIAAQLKFTYWAGSAYHDVFGAISMQKNKTEISQRFYCVQGQTGITVDEAFRYLQNRWLEREVLSKKKQAPEPGPNRNASEKSRGLLRKKRTRRQRSSKSDNQSEE